MPFERGKHVAPEIGRGRVAVQDRTAAPSPRSWSRFIRASSTLTVFLVPFCYLTGRPASSISANLAARTRRAQIEVARLHLSDLREGPGWTTTERNVGKPSLGVLVREASAISSRPCRSTGRSP